ncbi:Alpha/Beta hydrolase protein [Tuber borchii]|uniref:Alpha/Beta hydrolase protein n=1 Tax=Tuber borchii TaxID=42251 RepID=A0A2T6ZID5_TUBBO|nr:Alpha/Beta hydrolase protein [Tuber borchii]
MVPAAVYTPDRIAVRLAKRKDTWAPARSSGKGLITKPFMPCKQNQATPLRNNISEEIDISALKTVRIFLLSYYRSSPGVSTKIVAENEDFSCSRTPIFNELALRGTPHDRRVVQFRGIEFGEFTKRDAKSTVVESYPIETDSTSHGPMCPQSIFDDEDILFRIPENQRKRVAAGPTQNESQCLSLVITVPSSILNSPDSEEVLPVFVNIHGGANKWISSSVPLLDMANFVKKSMDIGKPIEAVGINYRLNIFPLKWVQKHIHGFRGDPKMVTIGCNRASSFSTKAHLNAMPESDAKGLFNHLSKKIAKNLSADVEKEGWEEVLKAAPAQDVVPAIEKDEFNFSPYQTI